MFNAKSMPQLTEQFQRDLMSIGIVSYREQETLWDIAQRCARTVGVPLAGTGFLIGTQIGTVVIPGVGTVAGEIAGTLAGLAGGTIMCVTVNESLRSQLRALANDSR